MAIESVTAVKMTDRQLTAKVSQHLAKATVAKAKAPKKAAQTTPAKRAKKAANLAENHRTDRVGWLRAAVLGAYLIPVVSVTSLVFLAILGGLAAYAGGASATRGAIRVTFWGALAMALTAGVGALFGTVV